MQPVRQRLVILLAVSVIAGLFVIAPGPGRQLAVRAWRTILGRRSVEDRLKQFGPAVKLRLAASFEAAILKYSPKQLAFVAFKDSRLLELYGRMADDQPWKFIRDYPILGTSGQLGPKQQEGDRQIPEGLYEVESLNPNSRFHLSIRLNYPNDFDRQMAVADRRTSLGGDVMVHGGSASIGCLAIGDQAAEDFFVLTALVGNEHVVIIISPTDFRSNSQSPDVPDLPPWIDQLYDSIRSALQHFHRDE